MRGSVGQAVNTRNTASALMVLTSMPAGCRQPAVMQATARQAVAGSGGGGGRLGRQAGDGP